MSDSLLSRTCSVCKAEKPCTVVPFIPKGDHDAAPAPYAGTTGLPAPNQFYLNCCADCGLEKGTIRKKAWIVTFIGYVLFVGGIVVLATDSSSSSAVAAFPMLIGWMMSLIASIVLIVKLRYECSNGLIGVLVALQFFPVVGLVALLLNAGKINRCARAVTALKSYAGEYLQQEKNKDEEMALLAAKGDRMTESEKKLVEDYQKEKENREEMAESARKAQEAQVNRGNYRGAIIGIVFTVILAFIGISTYSSGRGYMTFFGIQLSPGGFALVICAFLAWDVISIINAKKKM